MAISQFKVKVGKKGKATPHANYIMREDKYGDDFGKHANGIYKEVELTGYGNMPGWAKDNPMLFWKMADEHERDNGTTYREFIISLPRELNFQQRTELFQAFIKQEIGDKHAYQFAMHNPPALDGGEQPHVHFMFSERLNDGLDRSPDTYFKRYNAKFPERGGAKKASVSATPSQRKAELKKLRSRWEKVCNKYLEKYGFDERIDMRNWKERGLDEKPVNISMKDMQKPEIKQAYYQQLVIKKELQNEEQKIEQLDIEITDKRINENKPILAISEQQIARSEQQFTQSKQRIANGNLGLGGQSSSGQIRTSTAVEIDSRIERAIIDSERAVADTTNATREALQSVRERKQRLAEINRERLNNPINRTPKDLFRFLVNAVTPKRKKYIDENGTGNNLVAIDYAFEQYQANKELGIFVDYSVNENFRVVKKSTNSYSLKSTAQAVFSTLISAFKSNDKSIIDDYKNVGIGEFCEKYSIALDNEQIAQYHAKNPALKLTQSQSQQSVEKLIGFKMNVVFYRAGSRDGSELMSVSDYDNVCKNGHPKFPHHTTKDLRFDSYAMLDKADKINNPSLRELNKFLADNCDKPTIRQDMQKLNILEFISKYPININAKEVLDHAPQQLQADEKNIEPAPSPKKVKVAVSTPKP